MPDDSILVSLGGGGGNCQFSGIILVGHLCEGCRGQRKSAPTWGGRMAALTFFTAVER